MLEAKTIYSFLAFIMAIISSTLGLFLLLSSASAKNPGLKPYNLSRKVLAIAYIILGMFYLLDGIMISNEVGGDLFIAANISLVLPLCQAYLFTYALIILIEPSFASHKWNRVQQICIAIGFISIIVGFFLGIKTLQYVFFSLCLSFYFYFYFCKIKKAHKYLFI